MLDMANFMYERGEQIFRAILVFSKVAYIRLSTMLFAVYANELLIEVCLSERSTKFIILADFPLRGQLQAGALLLHG